MRVLDGAGSFQPPTGAGRPNHWVEHLSVPDLSVGTYSIPAGGIDTQTPHTEDEIYVVTGGRATIEAGGESAEVGPGAVVYVPAGEEHRFVAVTADFAVLVIFAPAEYSRQ